VSTERICSFKLVKYSCYNLYLSAAFDGTRLNKLYAEDLDHASILAALGPLFAAYARERPQGERFASVISAFLTFCLRVVISENRFPLFGILV
jgi:sulfite reductase beta subunit-like hemoprotein